MTDEKHLQTHKNDKDALSGLQRRSQKEKGRKERSITVIYNAA
jgi:hypothetical protein